MATINYAAKEISVKIVFYGPALSGKTTNLQIIHRKVPMESKSDMVSLATETDRTLFFDFLPLDLGTIKGFAIKFQLYTVPGQVYYNATRKLVLRGVDGIVFVADSAADKQDENLESFQNMEDNLSEYGYKLETIPIIIQYNKRDLPNTLPIDTLEGKLNKYNFNWTEATANRGKGVFETLKLIGKLVIDQLNKKYATFSKKPGQRVPAQRPEPVQPSRFSKQPTTPQTIFSPGQPPVQPRPATQVPPLPPQPGPVKKSPAQYNSPPPWKTPLTPRENKSGLDLEIERYQNEISKRNVQTSQFPQQNAQPKPQQHPTSEPIFEISPKPPAPINQFINQPPKPPVQPYSPPQGQFEVGPKPSGLSTTPPEIKRVIAESIPRHENSSGKNSIKKPMYFTTMDADDLGKKEKKLGKTQEKTKKSFFSKLFKRGSE